jgi:hypothetical protein
VNSFEQSAHTRAHGLPRSRATVPATATLPRTYVQQATCDAISLDCTSAAVEEKKNCANASQGLELVAVTGFAGAKRAEAVQLEKYKEIV